MVRRRVTYSNERTTKVKGPNPEMSIGRARLCLFFRQGRRSAKVFLNTTVEEDSGVVLEILNGHFLLLESE
jgi:hypothetical protein